MAAPKETPEQALARRARENPYGYFTHEEARTLFRIGEKAFRALVALGAPIVAGGVLPDHLKQWLWENRERIGKLTT